MGILELKYNTYYQIKIYTHILLKYPELESYITKNNKRAEQIRLIGTSTLLI